MISTYQPRWLPSPIDLPERRVGKLAIEHVMHKAGERLDVISLRESVCTGKRQAYVILKQDTRIHRLIDDAHGVWMTDLPSELNQMMEGIHAVFPFGKVCVGGLGLGILPGMLRDNREHLLIEHITVVERDPAVIELCAAPGYAFVEDDIYHYLQTCEPFHCFMLDTWQGQNEGTYWSEVLPAQRIIRNRFGGLPSVWCWKLDEMHGQVLPGLMRKGPHWMHKQLPTGLSEREARWFLAQVGTDKWERKYGSYIPRKEIK